MIQGGRSRSAVGVLVSVGALALLPSVAGATTITVNNTGDAAAEDAACTLREAIVAANTNAESGDGVGGAPECVAGQAPPAVDTIAFSIAGAGPHVISPNPSLPSVLETVMIDGSTEADEVRLDGIGAGVSSTGLDVAAADVTIDELTIVRFATGVDISGATDAVVRDSFIGTDPAATAGLGNTDGIHGGAGVQATTGALIRDNTISGNATEGVFLEAGASEVEIAGNRIGTGPGGANAVPNGQEGVEVIGGADGITIGGDEAADANLVSGNGSGGVRFFNSTTDRAEDNAIAGNRIGTRVGGELALANGGPGITMSGGLDSTEIHGNLISANENAGVSIDDATPAPDGEPGPTGTTIAGNLIGTDIDGAEPLGNESFGVRITEEGDDHAVTGTVVGGASGLTPGGPCTGDCNVIAATTGSVGTGTGLDIIGTEGTSVLGNHIGTDLAGTADLGNGGAGLSGRDLTDAEVGAPGAGNVVSGNGESGILLVGNDPGLGTGTSVQANTVGLGADGTTALGNAESGVFVAGFAAQNRIGGTGAGEGNVIAENSDEGVTIADDTDDISVLGNSVHSNGDLGIDLGNNTVSLNDPGDADVGANGLQNFPELDVTVSDSEGTGVVGALDSTPDTTFRVELFAADAEPQNFGEGEAFLGALEVATDAAGLASFSTVVGPTSTGDEIMATATEIGATGEPLSTSEFSQNQATEACDVPASSGDDVLTGTGTGDDVVCGLAGDDVFTPDGGDDVFFGGSGTDEIDYSTGADPIDADLDTGVISRGAGAELVMGVEDVTGTDFEDLIAGDAVANVLKSGAGQDTIEGRDGDDRLVGSDNADTLKGGDGADELKGQDASDELRGQSGDNDDLSGGAGKDKLNGGGGTGDDCNGGGNKDDEPAKGCESTSSIP